MRTVAILPVKRFPAAKQRLREGVEPTRREELVQAMFTDVLRALRHADLEAILVVTGSPVARRVALKEGAEVLADEETGHNAAASLGVAAARQRGAERALLVPGDCPALDPQELDALLHRTVQSPSAIVVPDRHVTGTNALLLTPPDSLAPAFGPDSCQRHVRLAREAGLDVEVVQVPSLALDIDTPEDLALLSGADPERALLTRRVLTQSSRC
jgi:2-phospho-L-lactate/phosphoenolpyruvate guanylyltransferase